MTYNASVKLGRDPGVLGPEGEDDPADTEINTGSKKCGSNGEAADLHEEAVLGPLVLPAHDATSIANDLADEPKSHGEQEYGAAPREGVHADETE